MPDPNLTAAIKEAYASVPSDVVILHTLSLSHPNWKDAAGKAIALYFVRDHVDFSATIESDATLDAGKVVTFKATAFQLTPPKVQTTSVPEVVIKVDNVDGELFPYLDLASSSKEKVTVIYRPYLSSNPTEVQMSPVLELTLTDISVSVHEIVGKARMGDMGNRAYPNQIYDLSNFPALANF